jgi:hypothetical protein
MREENLIPQAHELTVEEQSMGGKASGEKRRRLRDMKSSMNALLRQPAGERAKKYAKLVEDYKEDPTLQDEMLAALLALALTGDVAAIKQVREIVRDDDRLKIEQERLKLEKKKLEKNDDGLEKLDEILDQIRGTAAKK